MDKDQFRGPITHKLSDGTGLTQRMDDAIKPDASLEDVLKPSDKIDNRYSVLSGPLGGKTGEAEVYQCRDEDSGSIVAVKLYRNTSKPRQEVIDQLLNLKHPHLVELKSASIWQGRFYEVMEFCSGGVLAEHLPLSESVLRELLPDILSGLEYCHDQGIVHRDIKPGNLYYRDEDKQEIIIGDFGISSYLSEDHSHRTQSYMNLTLDYAAPELLNREEVSPATDFYALGITLLHSLLGVSPFAEVNNPNAILSAHLMGRVPRGDKISTSFNQLIDGLLQVRPENRWGAIQVRQWLQNEPILTSQGTQWHAEFTTGLEVPFPGFPEACTPQELAQNLDRFNAERHLFRGDIYRWVFDYFDSRMAEQIQLLEEVYAENHHVGVFKLRYILDPTYPLKIESLIIKNTEDLYDLLAHELDAITETRLAYILYSGLLEAWLTATQPLEWVNSILPGIHNIIENQPDKKLGLFQFRYLINPALGFSINESIVLRKPEDLAELGVSNPEYMDIICEHYKSGRYVAWLQIAFPGRSDLIEKISQLKKDFVARMFAQEFFAFLCIIDSAYPFPFLNSFCRTPEELAHSIDVSTEATQEGIRLMNEDWIRVWLVYTGRLVNLNSFQQIMNSSSINDEEKMEKLLHVLDPVLAWPELIVNTDFVDFGKVFTNETYTREIVIRNRGRGYLSGLPFVQQDDEQALSIEPDQLLGNYMVMKITLNTVGLPVSSKHRVLLIIETNGGNLAIPIMYQTKVSYFPVLGKVLLAGLLVGTTLGLYRYLILISAPGMVFSFPPQFPDNLVTSLGMMSRLSLFNSVPMFLFWMNFLVILLIQLFYTFYQLGLNMLCYMDRKRNNRDIIEEQGLD